MDSFPITQCSSGLSLSKNCSWRCEITEYIGYILGIGSTLPISRPTSQPTSRWMTHLIFAFYFDTSGRRSCYIAPERFFASSSRPDGASLPANTGRENKDVRVTEAMDVFSAGCVIAEVFREGAPLFTLSQLFKYREGELNIDGLLALISAFA
jgi:phosphoinositide-3-kinase, regulatory subunit 4